MFDNGLLNACDQSVTVVTPVESASSVDRRVPA